MVNNELEKAEAIKVAENQQSFLDGRQNELRDPANKV